MGKRSEQAPESTASIPLYAQDGSVRAYALVDAEDFERFGHLRWALDSKGYVYRHVHSGNKDRPRRLHREIMGVTDPLVKVDHINRNKLDNRRENLAPGTQGRNQQNRSKQAGSSRHRGVTLYRNGRWMAQCQLDGKMHFLGYYVDEDDAGRAAAEFRALNMPSSDEGRARALGQVAGLE